MQVEADYLSIVLNQQEATGSLHFVSRLPLSSQYFSGFFFMLQYLGKYPFQFRSPKSTDHIPLPNDRFKCDRGYFLTFKTVVNGIDSNQNQKTDALQVYDDILKYLILFLNNTGRIIKLRYLLQSHAVTGYCIACNENTKTCFRSRTQFLNTYFPTNLSRSLPWFGTEFQSLLQIDSNIYRWEEQSMTNGSLPGSSLGPVLYLIYINDLPNCSNAVTFRIFADDTNVFAAARDLKALEEIVNSELKKVKIWCDVNRLSINFKTNLRS